MPRKPLPPILVHELQAAGISVTVCCPICHHRAKMDIGTLDAPPCADMDWLSRRLLCTGCGRKGGISAYPDAGAWVRHLRATGQRHRLPWFECFIRD